MSMGAVEAWKLWWFGTRRAGADRSANIVIDEAVVIAAAEASSSVWL